MKFLNFLLLSLISLQSAFSQELFCMYLEHSEFGYSCHLHIQNPNGYDNFTHIDGNHDQGRSDSDVTFISPMLFGQSRIFPSIICQQFFNLRVIHLNSIVLERLGDEAFRSCRNLTELLISRNPITEISENAFAENENLRELTIRNSLLVELPRNVFTNQHSLEHLIVEENQLQNLPDGIFDSLTNLQTLSLALSRLTSLPNGIFNELKSIISIILSNNPLTTLHSSLFANLTTLTSINFSSNRITSLPQNLFNTLESLEILILTRNNLTTIHSNAFGVLPNLFELRINFNQINSVDERLIDNTGIRSLTTGNNPCDTTGGAIVDNTESREIIRAALRRCFNNFKDNQCEAGNLDERVCRLEEEVRELRELIKEPIGLDKINF